MRAERAKQSFKYILKLYIYDVSKKNIPVLIAGN